MNVTARQGKLGAVKADGLIVGVFTGGKLAEDAKRLNDATGGALARLVRRVGFEGAASDCRLADLDGTRAALTGLGAKKDVTAETVRRAAARGMKALSGDGARTVACRALGVEARRLSIRDAAQATTEGVLLADYQWDRYKSKKRKPGRPRSLTVLASTASEKREIEAGARMGRIIAEATCTARDLSNLPGKDGAPSVLAKEARRIAKGCGLMCTVLSVTQMKKLGMGALLAVAQGSANAPHFIILEHGARRRNVPTIVVVGKGVTFDSGGISIKGSAGMEEMRFDKSGGCVTLGLLQAVGRLRLPLRVVGLVPCVENLPGATAYRPGDILTSLSGKTIEVYSTDAEGRLILADALTYAERFKPDVVIDLATLTGAIMVALGKHCAGAYFSDEKLAGRMKAASERSGERIWRMPLLEEYRAEMNGVYSDLKNTSGSRFGGANTAAGFLWNFAESYP